MFWFLKHFCKKNLAIQTENAACVLKLTITLVFKKNANVFAEMGENSRKQLS
jgi:hypothetical protein